VEVKKVGEDLDRGDGVQGLAVGDDAIDIDNPPASIRPDQIDEQRLLLLEDGHCLKDHALSACNRPELRAEARMLGTSLHTLVQMVDNGLGLTILPQMAIDAGILNGTDVVARPLEAAHPTRTIALVWRKASPRGKEFQILANVLRTANERARAPD
jgi:LysR family hydrogen peroxide-inducible transcriptional activator